LAARGIGNRRGDSGVGEEAVGVEGGRVEAEGLPGRGGGCGLVLEDSEGGRVDRAEEWSEFVQVGFAGDGDGWVLESTEG
jgi:hypothetical protein